MSFSRAFHWYHSHLDPIWPDGTFKKQTIFFGSNLKFLQFCNTGLITVTLSITYGTVPHLLLLCDPATKVEHCHKVRYFYDKKKNSLQKKHVSNFEVKFRSGYDIHNLWADNGMVHTVKFCLLYLNNAIMECEQVLGVLQLEL
jgi:hypothetical protein